MKQHLQFISDFAICRAGFKIPPSVDSTAASAIVNEGNVAVVIKPQCARSHPCSTGTLVKGKVDKFIETFGETVTPLDFHV